MVMTSGCLTNLAIWDESGGFSDELFIDEVDHDYCLNVRRHGYRVVRLAGMVCLKKY
jgi:rhamnosyltransferase